MSGVVKRNTWQRELVRASLASRTDFVSAQKLYAELRESGSSISLATVYRALTDLVDARQADALQSPEGEQLYRACTSAGHHHHLICRLCGLTCEISAEPVEQWAATIAAENGFTQPHHVVDVFGVCADCAESSSAEAYTTSV